MLKHTLKLLVSKATTLPTKLGGSKERWPLKQNQINLRKQNNSIARSVVPPPFLYYPQVYLRSLRNQLMEQQYSFLECMWMLSGNGPLGLFALWGYCLIPEKVPSEVTNPNWL